MTRCPLQPRGGPPRHAPAPTADCRPLAFTLGPWQAGWVAGTQGTESLLLKPKQRCWASFPGKRGSRRLVPLLAPHLGRLSVPPTLSQGRGKGHPQRLEEDSRPVALSQKGSGPVHLLLSQHPRASSGPRARSGRKGLTSSSAAHSPHPLKSRPLPSRPPHPLGVSQHRAGGTAWLGTRPAEKGTPSLPGKGRGETVRAGGGSHMFHLQTPLTLGLGLPNRSVLMQSCKAVAYLTG